MPEGGKQLFALADCQRRLRRLGAIKKPLKEPAKASVDIVLLQCRGSIGSFDLLDVETDIANFFRDKEVDQFVDRVERRCSDNTNDMKRNVVPAQVIYALHDACVCSLAGSGPPPEIMEPSRPIETHAHTNRMVAEKTAPFVVQKHAVGLHRVRNVSSRRRTTGNRRKRLPVPIHRQHQRLAGVPHDGEVGCSQPVLKNKPHRGFDDVERHAVAVATGGQITVLAVDVAERRWLQDEEARPAGAIGRRNRSHRFRQFEKLGKFGKFRNCAT